MPKVTVANIYPSPGVEQPRGSSDRGRRSPSPGPAQLSIPKNRSTPNFAHAGTEKARIRFSFDAGLAAAEYDTMSRLVSRHLVLRKYMDEALHVSGAWMMNRVIEG